MKKVILTILGTLTMFSNSNAQEVVVGNQIDESMMSVRFRSFDNTGGDEVYVGVPNVGVAANRNELEHDWWEYNHLEVSYDSLTDVLDVILWHCSRTNPNAQECGQNSNRSPHEVSYPNWSTNMQGILGSQFSVNNLMALSVTLYNRDGNTDVSLTNVQLNGAVLGGDFNMPPTSVRPSVDSWTIVNSCFNDFNFSGDIQLLGDFSNSQELSKIEINVGTEKFSSDVIFSNGFEPCYGVSP